ncbi:MAG: transporter [Legionella sp.]|uniref:transporter n=1 Tax=Legionella sp. TaxID=459 RepID=UPI002850C536|nr:transporter [Legionella sp.]
MHKLKFVLIVSTFCAPRLYADCSDFMNLADRPSVMDSACATAYRRVVIESNFIAQQLNANAGTQYNLPNTEVRIGLPSNTEFMVLLPNYIRQTTAPKSGSTGVFAGLKHSINYSEQWLFAVIGNINIPSGSYDYGNLGWGGLINGIATYNINSKWSISGMLGVSELSDSQSLDGRYFTSINPDISLSYSPSDWTSVYAEVYGQSKIDSVQSAGFNFDAGVLVLVHSNVIINLSAGQQLYGYLGGFTHYINAGISIRV